MRTSKEQETSSRSGSGGGPPDRNRVVALKFGGSSLLGAERILHAAGLVRAAATEARAAVVVSAMKGVTDQLLSVARSLAEQRYELARSEAEFVLNLHLRVLEELEVRPVDALRVRRECRLLGRDLLHEIGRQRPVPAGAELSDRLASFGERFSARLFAAALEKSGVAAVPVASSEFVVTCDTFRDAQPHLEESRKRGREILLPMLELGIVPVVTGFIGSTPDGRVTTLGRNSSDFSGALVAHLVGADELVIWTDVDGIFSANPHQSAEARLLHELSYDEAHALAAAGARVLHERVVPLAAETEMVVWVRNTFNPSARGTRISGAPVSLEKPLSRPAVTV